MAKKLLFIFGIMIAAALNPTLGRAEVNQSLAQELQGDWTNLDGESGRFIISFNVTEGLLKKGYLDPQNGEYRELNTTRVKFTVTANNLISLDSLDDATDSAECEFKQGGQELFCRDNDASGPVMRLRRYQTK